ncbi:MAG: aminopeptidase [Bacteroidales bacterium]|nr:aminopeptidase [Bacteroidales bacterium]
MKKSIVIAAALGIAALFAGSAYAQSSAQVQFPDYQFTTVKANPITPIKNQASSGTCWAYSTIAFLESEIIRINKITDEARYPDLSVFWIVSHSYSERAEKYIRLDGNLTFGAGSEADDVLHVIRDHGIVPLKEMTGMNYGTELPKQAELDAILNAYVSAVAKNPNRTLTTAWKRGFDAILNEYLGKRPETFTVDGKSYDPISYRDALKLNVDDYVSLSSFTHHPFYTWFPLEVCDNWRWDSVYNVPIDELMKVLDDAIMNGYTAAWGADVSDPGFTRTGLAIFVDVPATAAAGSDQEHWVGREEGRPAPVAIVEKKASQEQRQQDFDNKTMTDDHGMQIFGIARDQFGKKYYMVRNSWGVTGKFYGIWYATEDFVKGQTLDIVLHKDALPKDLRKKIGK